MIIWFIHHYAIPPDQSGGIRHYLLAKRLVAHGHRVLLVASSYHHQLKKEKLRDGVDEMHEVVDGVEFLWVRTSPYYGNSVHRLLNLVSFAWSVMRSPFLRDSSGPQVVLGSSPQPFAALIAHWIAKRRRARFIYEVRDIWPQTLVDLGRFPRWHPLVLLFGWIERRSCQSADHVVTLLPHSAEHLVRKGADRSRISVIPNGVDLTMVGPPSPPPFRDELIVMYAGALGAANAVDVLIAAAAMLARDPRASRIRFRIIGEGPEKANLQKLCEELGATNVVFSPYVAKDKVYALLREADIFVMILRDSPVFRWGVSPNKLFDYMAVGRPIVFAVNTPSNPVTDAGAGLSADPTSPEDLAAKILDLASRPAVERLELGRRARAYGERHHDIARLAEEFAGTVLRVSGEQSS